MFQDDGASTDVTGSLVSSMALITAGNGSRTSPEKLKPASDEYIAAGMQHGHLNQPKTASTMWSVDLAAPGKSSVKGISRSSSCLVRRCRKCEQPSHRLGKIGGSLFQYTGSIMYTKRLPKKRNHLTPLYTVCIYRCARRSYLLGQARAGRPRGREWAVRSRFASPGIARCCFALGSRWLAGNRTVEDVEQQPAHRPLEAASVSQHGRPRVQSPCARGRDN